MYVGEKDGLMMDIDDMERACKLAELANIGCTLTAAEFRWLLEGVKILEIALVGLEEAAQYIDGLDYAPPDSITTAIDRTKEYLGKIQPDPDICPICRSDLGHRINCPRGIAFTK